MRREPVERPLQLKAVIYRTSTTTGSGANGGGGADGDRVTPRALSASITPGRDTSAPHRFRVRGRLRLPAGASALARAPQADLCTGKMRITVKQSGRRIAPRDPRALQLPVRADGPGAALRRAGTLKVKVRFRGDQEVKPRNARTRTVRFGPG